MKATLRLPTQDQYAFIEVETEVLSTEDAVTAYYEAMKLIKPQEGLPTKEFNAFLDEILNTGKLSDGVERWNKMDKFQQSVLQEIKKAYGRIEYSSRKEIPSDLP